MYSISSRVRFSEVDKDERLTVTALFCYMQDCSTFESEDMGLGINTLMERGHTWLVSAWNVCVDKLPKFCDEIVVSTWAHGFTNVFGLRNFLVASPNGEVYARADSLWFVYDFGSQSAIRVPSEYINAYMENSGDRIDMPKMRRRVTLPGQGALGRPIVVDAHHLDSNGHVNNVQYVGMAMGAAAAASVAEGAGGAGGGGAAGAGRPFLSGRIDVQYKQAAFLGDTITPRVCMISAGDMHGESSGASSSNACDACVVSLDDANANPYALVRFEYGD